VTDSGPLFVVFLIGKIIQWLSKTFNFGAGGTWPGEIALKIDPNILRKIAPKNIILVAGTNGKTTTSLMVKTLLENGEHRVIHNASGANLLNGVVSAILTSTAAVWGVFEVDENSLPIVLKFIKPKVIVLLNLFRDQLDRYGEVDTIADNWQTALSKVPKQGCSLTVNADDPHLAWIGKNIGQKVFYFGLGDKRYFLPQPPHATDSLFCPHCSSRLVFAGHYISHLGEWHCPKCDFTHPKLDLSAKDIKSPLDGVYNLYNVLAATLTAKTLGLSIDLSRFAPAFGRAEEINGAKILLSKNPAGFNESLRTILDSKHRGPILLVLNDRIPDGRDVSWIWDVDFELLQKYPFPIYVSGDRAFDLALRLKYAAVPVEIKEELNASWILPTYSAMLDIRKKLTGKKIL